MWAVNERSARVSRGEAKATATATRPAPKKAAEVQLTMARPVRSPPAGRARPIGQGDAADGGQGDRVGDDHACDPFAAQLWGRTTT